MEYIILTSLGHNTSDLSKKVEEKLNDGYQLYGNLSCVFNADGFPHYSQVVIKS